MKTFVDTNVLLYAHDHGSAAKQRIAEKQLLQLWSDGNGVLSPQVLQEFYVNAVQKLSPAMAQEKAQAIVLTYSEWCIEMTATEVLAAFHIQKEARISFWDSLIVASARRAGADRILTEDMNSGQVIAGVRIENPFLATEHR